MRINNKKIRRKLETKNSVDDLVRRYLLTDGPRRPRRHNRHLGIEVECFGPKNRVALQKLVLSMDLEKYIQVGRDGSIRRTAGMTPYELRILLPESRLTSTMNKIGKFFKLAKLQVNNSCGLHVHIDMRSRSHTDSYAKLFNAQDLLFSMVAASRWRNSYCKYTTKIEEFNQKYRAVTLSSYYSKRTLEVRLHEGCVDTDKITKWIKLLLQIVDSNSLNPGDINKDVVKKWAKRGIQKYIDETFNEKWIKEKKKYVHIPQTTVPTYQQIA